MTETITAALHKDAADPLRAFKTDENGEPLTCFYCDVPIPRSRLEMDHMPVPDRCGGDSLVPACIVCHDLKDRVSLLHLPVEFLEDFMRDFSRLSRNSRIIMAKLYAIGCTSQCAADGIPLRKKHRTKAKAVTVTDPHSVASTVN